MSRLSLFSFVLAGATFAASPVGAQAPMARTDSARRDYTAADVAFMSGMIYHHAQAILMAGWAQSHGASPSVQTLCNRIIASQTDEINLLSRWLADRHEAVPHPEPAHMMMPGMSMSDMHMMPGMLTQAQLVQLDSARGPQFDELFLRDMIQHHQGAITMVHDLFAASGGEEEPVYKIATGIFADQTTEIERMQRMLANELFPPPR